MFDEGFGSAVAFEPTSPGSLYNCADAIAATPVEPR
jgi:hypothetical protein